MAQKKQRREADRFHGQRNGGPKLGAQETQPTFQPSWGEKKGGARRADPRMRERDVVSEGKTERS